MHRCGLGRCRLRQQRSEQLWRGHAGSDGPRQVAPSQRVRHRQVRAQRGHAWRRRRGRLREPRRERRARQRRRRRWRRRWRSRRRRSGRGRCSAVARHACGRDHAATARRGRRSRYRQPCALLRRGRRRHRRPAVAQRVFAVLRRRRGCAGRAALRLRRRQRPRRGCSNDARLRPRLRRTSSLLRRLHNGLGSRADQPLRLRLAQTRAHPAVHVHALACARRVRSASETRRIVATPWLLSCSNSACSLRISAASTSSAASRPPRPGGSGTTTALIASAAV